MFITDLKKDGTLHVRVEVPLLAFVWDCGHAVEYIDPETKNLFVIEAACRDDEFMGASSTITVLDERHSPLITLELPESEFVEFSSRYCAEDEGDAGASIRIKAVVPPDKHRVLATVDYVCQDQLKTEATS